MFGPRVIGEEAFKAQQAAQATGSDMFGPRVTGPGSPSTPVTESAGAPSEPPAESPAAPSDAPEPEQYRVNQIADMLSENPATLDLLLDLEEQRPLPRVTAVSLFRQVELAGENRPEIVARIDALDARLSG